MLFRWCLTASRFNLQRIVTANRSSVFRIVS